jgi:magnesium chelatase subunit H
VRKHALAYQAEHGCDLETAALRVFSNAEGAYGSNVNLLVDNSRWEDEASSPIPTQSRKCFAYGRRRQGRAQAELLGSMLPTCSSPTRTWIRRGRHYLPRPVLRYPRRHPAAP